MNDEERLEQEWQAFTDEVLRVYGDSFQPLGSALRDRDQRRVILCLQVLQDTNCFRTRIPGSKVIWEGTCEMFYG